MLSLSCSIRLYGLLLAALVAANSPVEAFVSTTLSIQKSPISRAALPFFIDADVPKENENPSTDIVLFGLGDLRVDDHGGLHRALTSPKSNSILPLCILDASSLAQFPGACAHTADTAACIHAGLTELANELQEKCSLLLQVIVAEEEVSLLDCVQNVLDSTAVNKKEEINLHVCDLGPADNQIGYGPFSKLATENQAALLDEVNIVSWNNNLRDQPWQKLESLPSKYTEYEKQFFSMDSVARPLNTPAKTSDSKSLNTPMATDIPSLEEFEKRLSQIVSKRNPLLDQPGRLEAEKGTGLFMTHWGGLDAGSTVGCQSARAVLDAYVGDCEQDDKAWFTHKAFPGSSRCKRNMQSLEHASMKWQLEGDGSYPTGNADNWMAGESMTRFLAAPLMLGTISPRRVWEQSTMATRKGVNFAFVPPLERLVEAREWHRLLAARNIQCQPSAYNTEDEGTSVYYRYWRYQGFLCRYAARSLASESQNKGILLVHGFGASGAQWNKAMDSLARLQNDESVEFGSGLAPDLLGFGESEKPALSYTGYMWDSQVLDFVKECAIPKHSWESFVVGGNSIGGFTSMSAAACDTASIASNDGCTLVTSSGAPGTGLCDGLVLMNSAGPIKTREEIESAKLAADATASQNPQSGSTRLSIAQMTAIGALPICSPPPRPVARSFGNGLLLYLRPNIQSICVNLYPTNPSAVDDLLCGSIERDSLDPGAINVMMAGAKLPVPRTANELLNSDFRMGVTDESNVRESTFDGPVLVAQGVLDPLNDAQDRLERFGALREGITMDGIQAGHCPHDELPEQVAQSILKWRKRVTTSVSQLPETVESLT